MVAVKSNHRSNFHLRPARLIQLSRGDHGPKVRAIQRRLNIDGAQLAVDGIFGRRTEAAVRAFQRRNDLDVDGIVGAQTAAHLRQRTGSRSLRPGMENRATRILQQIMNGRGHRLGVDGRYGPQTTAAVQAFQRAHGLEPDGIFGPRTLSAMGKALGRASGDELRGALRPDKDIRARITPSPGQPANRTATFDRFSKRGQRSQMVEGRVTINGRTYRFRSGGGGRGHLPPGDYKITAHRWHRNDRTMSVGGVGYSFAMSDKYDPRVGGTRTLLRIHPDGGGRGTIGCMGIVGNAAVQRRFREDMRAELARNGGSIRLRVG